MPATPPWQLLIVDDEALARLRLRTLLGDVQAAQQSAAASGPTPTQVPGDGASDTPRTPSPQWQLAGEAASATEALQRLQQQAVHAVLLDIQMPGQDGLQLAQGLRALNPAPELIFVTAHAQHAVHAFELRALDYLTKPVTRERLAQALQGLHARLLERQLLSRLPVAPTGATEQPTAVLVIHERGRLLRQPVAELLYFRAENKQVLMRGLQGSTLIDDSLSELEERLAAISPGTFIRVHRNALVSLSAMRELQLRWQQDAAADAETSEGWAVRVAPLDEWLAVSRRQVAAVKAALASTGVVS